MSEESIQIHDDLIAGVLDVVIKNDARAEADMMLGLQYLAAVIGYIAASYPGPAAERDALLEHLAAFTKHVTDDRAASLQPQQQQTQQPPEAAKGHSEATDDPAIGIWKPE
jgi:hypothetical protein